MCGIVGYVGTKNIPGRAHFALDVVLEGLRRLEYRGYDSAGIAVLDEGTPGGPPMVGQPMPTLTRTW